MDIGLLREFDLNARRGTLHTRHPLTPGDVGRPSCNFQEDAEGHALNPPHDVVEIQAQDAEQALRIATQEQARRLAEGHRPAPTPHLCGRCFPGRSWLTRG